MVLFGVAPAAAWFLDLHELNALTSAYNGRERMRDYRAAVVAETLFQANAKDPGPWTFHRFFPSLCDLEDGGADDEEMTPEETAAYMQQWAAMMNARVAK